MTTAVTVRSRRAPLTERFPLRVSLVVVVVVLVAAALAVTGVVASSLLRNSLIQRVDGQLGQFAHSMASDRFQQPPPDSGRGQRRLPSSFYVSQVDSSGQPTGVYSQPLDSSQKAPTLPVLSTTQVAALNGEPFTVKQSGGPDWRVIALVESDGSGSVLVAQSLGDTEATVRSLTIIELIAGGVVLLLVVGSGSFLVRRSLRGLQDVERTAAAIAGGDLSRRVPDRDPRTEVGGLSVALNTMLGQIENAFAERTASEAEARRSEDRMRRFIADASHELRTPLTSIRGFAELSRMRGRGATTSTPSTPDVDAMGRIEQEAERMGLLVDELLLLARLDQQRPLTLTEVDLLAIAGDSVAAAHVQAPDRTIGLEILPGSQAPMVSGDEPRLRQVVTNLMANAVAHTPPASPIDLCVGTEGSQAVIQVRDHGAGLPAEQRDKVFERFYRADNARTRETGGSGLGLAIVAALVAAHDGTVVVTDTPGGGATFVVRLPLTKPR